MVYRREDISKHRGKHNNCSNSEISTRRALNTFNMCLEPSASGLNNPQRRLLIANILISSVSNTDCS